MGGAVSLFDQNDWSAASGGLTGDDDTIDGRPPTATYETYHLLKKAVLANQREFEVVDSKSNLIYTVRPCAGTIAGFDVLGVNAGPNEDDFLIHVAVDIARRYWTIYRVNVPFYPGQLPDEEATAKLAADLAKKDITTRLSESLAITSFVEPTKQVSNEAPIAMTEDAGLETQNDQQPVKYLLYKACCVTVSWSRYMAVASYYGRPSADQILSYNAKSAPSSDETIKGVLSTSSDEGNDVYENAADIQQRSKHDITENDTMVEDERKADTPDERSEPTEQSLVSHGAHANASKDESAIPLGTQISSRTLADDLASESDTASADDAQDLANVVILEVRSQHEVDEIDDTPSLTTSSSMPELTQTTKQLSFRSWFHQKSRDWQNTIAQTNFTTKLAEQDGAPKTQQQMLQNIFPMAIKAAKLPNPDEGVVHLDKPLLLCQEIYNKIIGNHQTSRVTKEQVMKLLKQDMEQHERNEEKTSADESSSIEVVDGRGPMVCAVSESPGSGVEESKEDVHAQEAKPQPLVGYWHWENTLRTHKMKMHLAKGSDLSLHVVLAVLVNQVRYERNAIAMTV